MNENLKKIEIKVVYTENKEIPDSNSLQIFAPHQPSPEAKEVIKAIGLEAYNAILSIEHIKNCINSKDAQNPHYIFQIISAFISIFITKDINYMHYDIVRKAINDIDSNLLQSPNIIDETARELIKNCEKLKSKLIIDAPKEFKEIFNSFKKECDNASPPNNVQIPFEILSISHDNKEQQIELENNFKKNNSFIWDLTFLDFLKSIGKNGEELAQEGLDQCKIVEKFEKNEINVFSLWFNISNNNPFYLSPALIRLTKVILKDVIKKRQEFKAKNVVALTTNVQEPLKKMLSPKNEIIEKDQKLHLLHHESVIGSISIPTISEKIINHVFIGITKLNTVTGHRLLRYFPKQAFNQKINGNSDYRVLKYDRGATEIAEHLDLNGGKQIANIKAILHAMAYFEFNNQNLSGNLIQLSKYKSPITHRQDEAFLITVGTPLLPYQTFEDGGLLIPLLTDPPLVNPNQFHAAQYLLQMEIMSEFSNQSINLFQNNAIEITQEKWELLAQSCGITPEVLKKVKDRWIQDGNDGAKFLEKLDNNYYTLGIEHQKALDFLKEQGSMRIKQSKRGTASAKKRIEAKLSKKRNNK